MLYGDDMETYMAVLCDNIVFSLSSNSWYSLGFRTLRATVDLVSNWLVKIWKQSHGCCRFSKLLRLQLQRQHTEAILV